MRIYVDGTMVASGSIAGALWQSTFPYLTLGQIGASGGAFQSLRTGQAKAVRITDGVVRYTTNGSYTVPTLPLPTS